MNQVVGTGQWHSVSLDTPRGPFLLDLVEWQESRDGAVPYPHLYHLGIARIALATDDLGGDMGA